MRSVLKAAGAPLPEGRFTASDIKRVFDCALQLRASGFSTISLPGILSNAANKTLLEGYRQVPASWRMFCSIGSNPDFKVTSRYRLTMDGSFEQVGKGGELKHGSLHVEVWTRIPAIQCACPIFLQTPTSSGVTMKAISSAIIAASGVICFATGGLIEHFDTKVLVMAVGGVIALIALGTWSRYCFQPDPLE